MFISPALAQQVAAGAQAPDGAPFRILLQFLVIFVVFYFFLIRPQQKKLKEHQKMQENVSKGDTIVTAGGIVGKVVRSELSELEVEIANGVTVTVLRDRVSAMHSTSKAKSDLEDLSQDNRTEKTGSAGLKDILTKK